jgi:prephenate dehydrogenase
MRIAIVGASGKMGKWFSNLLLKEGFELILTDKNIAELERFKQKQGVLVIEDNAEAVALADAVLVSVPIDNFEDAIREVRTGVKTGQQIFDITSVKEKPVEVMHRYLKGAVVLGTHPVFGPGARDLNTQNFVLTPTNSEESKLAEKARKFLEARGARVTIMSPAEHDQTMAVVLGLAHFIAIVSADTLAALNKIPRFKSVAGSTYRVLTTLVESVISEDPELYTAIQMNLPLVTEVESFFQSMAAKWAGYVRDRNRAGFKQEMVALKEKFAASNSDFGKAYENMYRIIEWL